MNLLKIAQQTLQTEAQALLDAVSTLDQSFLDAVELIEQTQGKLIVTGVGKSGLVGAKMAATFASTGFSFGNDDYCGTNRGGLWKNNER